MLPGLGNTAQAVGNIFFGSAVVIRNGIGTAAMIVLVCLALGPLLKMLVFSVFYKVAGALSEPFSDKRICGCIDCVGDGALLLFRALGTGIFIMYDNDSGGGDGNHMTEMLEWVKRMIFLGIFLTLLLQVLPANAYRKYVRFFAGMVFVVTIFKSIIFRVGTEKCRTEDWSGNLSGKISCRAGSWIFRIWNDSRKHIMSDR